MSCPIHKLVYMLVLCINVGNDSFRIKLVWEGVYFDVPRGREVASSSSAC